ncbi:MAG: hypothetical protein H6553_04955 [Chitinophagales bacterium]|nr:hypothetical protein [Chitinophagales bacterium]
MKIITLILFFLLFNFSFSQMIFKVNNFSKTYYGKVFIEDTTAVFSKGWVAIYNVNTNKKLIKVNSEELTYELHNGKMLANIIELPYGEQSQIIYEDFNFDGIKDFAIMDGQNSCYHGPSFQIYLATNNGFKYNEGFTKLAQEYCGMFNVDAKNKTISTMTKSGCCWHQFSEFKVENNNPYAIKIVEEGLGMSGITWDYIEENLVNGKMVTSEYQMLDVEINEDNLLLSFEFSNQKKMQIFYIENYLYYVFTDVDEAIELLYYENFKYSKSENSLTFINYNTQYTIYDEKIVIKTSNKNYVMKAAKNTIKGTLLKLKKIDFENLSK